MPTIIKIKTWRCPSCDYAQDYEPTTANHAIHFPGDGLQDGDCPACGTGQNPTRVKAKVLLVKETRPVRKTTVTVADEADLITGVDARSDKVVDAEFEGQAQAAAQADEDRGPNRFSDAERERRQKTWLDSHAADITAAKVAIRIAKKGELDAEKATLLRERERALAAMRALEDI